MNIQFLVRTIAYMISLISVTLHSSEVCTYSFNDFDTWFTKNKTYFEQKDKDNIPDLYKEPQNTPGTLTIAGMRYLMFTFPREMQKEIVKHLIPSLSPFIIGIQDNEINQKQFTISGYFTTKVMKKSMDSKFVTLWDTVTRISKYKDPQYFVFYLNSSSMHTVYEAGEHDVITWQVPQITKNHTYYCSFEKIFNLHKVLMLLDQENMNTKPTEISFSLSKRTQKLVANLKNNIEKTTNSTTIIKPTYAKKSKKKKQNKFYCFLLHSKCCIIKKI